MNFGNLMCWWDLLLELLSLFPICVRDGGVSATPRRAVCSFFPLAPAQSYTLVISLPTIPGRALILVFRIFIKSLLKNRNRRFWFKLKVISDTYDIGALP